MRNKRGQFYIIAAVIIVIAVSSITGIVTYAVAKPSPKTVLSLGSDLEKESFRIVDYGIYQKEDLDFLLESFMSGEFAPYFLKKTDNANVVFVYGDKADLYSIQYDTLSTGTISATIGGESQWTMSGDFAKKTKLTINPGDDKVEVTVLEKTFYFQIRDNEMFYFLIIQEKEGERYVEKN